MVTFSRIGSFGRFGNQLFQIASTIGVAHRNNTQAKFYPWQYSNCFKNPIDQTLKQSDIKRIYNEINFHHDPVPYAVGLDLYGYFQSWRYFETCPDLIRYHFDFVDNLVPKSMIDDGMEYCSIHVRRTDYLKLTDYHPFPGMDYYNKAIDEVENYGIKKFRIFSDDIPWCMSAFGNSEKFSYITGFNNVQDMCLMSHCHSNIIANSSFSWWGSWLNKNPDKIVIAPAKWFGPANGHASTKDLYCDGWRIR